MALFGWEQKGKNQNWTSEGLGVGLIRDKDDDGDRDVKSQLVVFGKFLRTGLGSDEDDGDKDYEAKRDRDREHMLVDAGSHGLPEMSNPYGYLNLFGEVKEGDHGEEGRFEDREERRNWLGTNYEGLVRQSLEDAKSHGGQAGRAAGVVLKVLASGFEGWKANDEEND